MGKDNKLLWIIAAVGAGWLLAPKEVKDQITEGMPSIGIDLSGLLGGGIGQAPLGLGGITGGISEEWFTEWWDKNKVDPFSEIPLLDFTGVIQDILDAGNTAAGLVSKAADDAAKLFPNNEDIAPPLPPSTVPSPWEEFTGLHPIVKNVIAGAVGIGGVYGVVKGVQAVAPAVGITTDAMARTLAAVLRGKKPPAGGVTQVKLPPLPKWATTKLGKQWLKYVPGLSKGLGRAGGLGLAPLGIMDIIQEFDWSLGPLGRGWPGEAADVTIPWTSGTWNLKPQPEGAFYKTPVPMRAEREYVPSIPAARRIQRGEGRYPRLNIPMAESMGNVPTKAPLYKPPLEGVQW